MTVLDPGLNTRRWGATRSCHTNFAVDSGIPLLQPYYGYTWHKDAWKSVFPKRTRVELGRRKHLSMRLRETNDGNRLTVDADALRLDIAQSATEIEREWLYR